MHAQSLVFKYALALISLCAYALIALLADRFQEVDGIPETGLWIHYLIGAIFGALILGPYAGRRHRVLRAAALAIAGAVIYHLAVRFVTDGPIRYDTGTAFILSGGAAAALSAYAVVAIAPRAFDWRVLLYALAAGALGGAVFELNFAFDHYLLLGHAAWQLLVCVALHFGLKSAPT